MGYAFLSLVLTFSHFYSAYLAVATLLGAGESAN